MASQCGDLGCRKDAGRLQGKQAAGLYNDLLASKPLTGVVPSLSLQNLYEIRWSHYHPTTHHPPTTPTPTDHHPPTTPTNHPTNHPHPYQPPQPTHHPTPPTTHHPPPHPHPTPTPPTTYHPTPTSPPPPLTTPPTPLPPPTHHQPTTDHRPHSPPLTPPTPPTPHLPYPHHQQSIWKVAKKNYMLFVTLTARGWPPHRSFHWASVGMEHQDHWWVY